MTLPRLTCLLSLLALPLAGCGDDDGPSDCPDCLDASVPTDGSSAVDAADVDPDMPSLCPPGEPEPEPWDCESDPGVADAEPIVADADTWTWVPFDDAFCMDGSTTGIGINPNPDSSKLLIMLEGGGACFDGISCLGVANQDGYDADKLDTAARTTTLGRGITDRTDEDNPFADWNYVYVPYCSGDAHSGTNPDGFGGRTQVGHTNYQRYIERIAATFAESVDEVVLGGRSAGGLGTIVNYPSTASAFGCTPVHMVNDSGALLTDTYLRPCLQQTTREVWGIVVPSECERCACDDGGGLVNSIPFLARRYPDRNFGLMSYTADGTFRQFFSYGYSAGCNLPTTMPPEDYEAGLLELRTLMADDSNFRTFLVSGDSHTFTFAGLADSTAGGVTLADWLQQLRTDDAAWTDVGP